MICLCSLQALNDTAPCPSLGLFFPSHLPLFFISDKRQPTGVVCVFLISSTYRRLRPLPMSAIFAGPPSFLFHSSARRRDFSSPLTPSFLVPGRPCSLYQFSLDVYRDYVVMLIPDYINSLFLSSLLIPRFLYELYSALSSIPSQLSVADPSSTTDRLPSSLGPSPLWGGPMINFLRTTLTILRA